MRCRRRGRRSAPRARTRRWEPATAGRAASEAAAQAAAALAAPALGRRTVSARTGRRPVAVGRRACRPPRAQRRAAAQTPSACGPRRATNPAAWPRLKVGIAAAQILRGMFRCRAPAGAQVPGTGSQRWRTQVTAAPVSTAAVAHVQRTRRTPPAKTYSQAGSRLGWMWRAGPLQCRLWCACCISVCACCAKSVLRPCLPGSRALTTALCLSPASHPTPR